MLPCIVSSIVSVVGSVIGYAYLEETAPAVVKRNKLKNSQNFGSDITMNQGEEVLLDHSGELERGDSVVSIQLPLSEIINGPVCISILCYSTWCLVTIMYEEVYALYVSRCPKPVGNRVIGRLTCCYHFLKPFDYISHGF